MKALILAGGFGTRLGDIAKDIPKPMVPIIGKPFIQHQMRALREQGLTDIVLAVHYMADKIKDYFGNGKRHGIDIAYSEESSPLGTAGAIKNAQRYLGNDRFMVLNGDTYSGLNLKEFMEFHSRENNLGTLAAARSDDAQHYGIVEVKNGKVIRFHEKNSRPYLLEPLISTGVYIFEPEIFDYIEAGRNTSLEDEVFPALASEGRLGAYPYSGYFMDISRPETYRRFKQDMIKSMLMKESGTIRQAIKKMNQNEEGLIFLGDAEGKLKGVVTLAFINKYLTEENASLEDPIEKIMFKDDLAFAFEGDSPEKIAEIMLPRTNRLPILNARKQIVDIVYRQDVIEKKEMPLFRARSPLRISFSGGGTDKEDYFMQFGTGIVISATIDKYCHATARIRPDRIIQINPEIDREIIDLRKGRAEYNGKFNLAKAVINIMRPEFGFDLHLRNDVPPGRGLGSSGSFAVMLTDLIANMSGTYMTNDKTAETARRAEVEELKIRGGWQDQYAAKVGGFNLIEFSNDKIIPSSLALSPDIISELEESLLLCYVGNTHNSGEIHHESEKHFAEYREKIRANLEQLKDIAIKIRDSLVSKNTSRVREIGSHLHQSWLLKKSLGGSISNRAIDNIYEHGLKHGAVGGKLLGAGSGGYLLFFAPPEKRACLENALSGEGHELMSFNFERHPVGSRIWPVY